MYLSVFEIFKVGIGPSSSHTMGPMVAASRFLDLIRHSMQYIDSEYHHNIRIQCSLHGSLAFTGKGHASDRAVMLGLSGYKPDTIDPDHVPEIEDELRKKELLRVHGLPPLHFSPDIDIIFDYDYTMPEHPNGMMFMLHLPDRPNFITETYFSVGGGFVVDKNEFYDQQNNPQPDDYAGTTVPFPFHNAKEMLEMGAKHNMRIADMQRQNELVKYTDDELDHKLDIIWKNMNACINRGMRISGVLPGGLNIKRRAHDLHQKLLTDYKKNDDGPHVINDWLSLYAMAVNEENAAGSKVVTSPTNGAAGVVPAVLRYYMDFVPTAHKTDTREFLLVAAAIGGIIKRQASISGAEVGCQGEVGSASAMSAAGMCSILNGTNEQIENAAEIALEHHLGMTCDPVAGLVQVPCIERNALGSVKSVTAASLALRGDGTHFVMLDNCIETMKQTGLDMHEKYKETSSGGLATFAVNLPAC